MTTDNGAAGAQGGGGQSGGAAGSGAQGGGAGSGGAPDWVAGLDDAGKAFVGNKGWKSPSDVLASYRNLEGQLGADKLVIPKGADDKAGWDAVWEKLGRPKDVAGYDLKAVLPEGSPVNEDFMKHMLPALHGAGLTQSQVAAATKAYQDFATNAMKAADGAFEQESALAVVELDKEWGAQAIRNKEVARRAAAEFGVKPDVLDKMERAVGTKDLLKLFHAIGEKLVEPALIRGETKDFRTIGPANAKEEIKALREDREFGAKLAKGDKDALEKWNRLHKLAFS